MYFLDQLKKFKIYKSKRLFYPLIDNQKKFSGNLILLDSVNLKDSIFLINNPSINNKYTKCYYIDKTAYAYIRSTKRKKIVNQSNYYKNIKSSCKGILKTFPTLDKYDLMSTYYDISPMNELYKEYAPSVSTLQKINNYKNFINHIFDNEEVIKYPSKFILCRITNEYRDFDTFKELSNGFLANIINTIYLKEDDILNYPNLTVIVLSETTNRFFTFNVHSLKKTHVATFKRLINILIKLERKEELSESELEEENSTEKDFDISIESMDEVIPKDDKEMAKVLIKQEVKPSSSKEEEIVLELDKIIDRKNDDLNLSQIEDDLNNDAEFMDFLNELKNEKLIAAQTAKNTARNELLKEEQKKIRINNLEDNQTMEEIISEIKEKTIEKEVIPMNNRNAQVLKESTLKDFEKSYNKNLDYKDKMTILNTMSKDNREIKVYVRSISKNDSSTDFTKKETWTIELEDERRTRHTIKVDFPVMMNDKFMWIEGNKKVLNKQLVLLPVVKTKPDEVQLVTNSNKTFITRFGSKTSPKMEKFKKFIAECSDNKSFELKLGNNINSNKKYITNIEYDELSELYTFIKIGKTTIYFNQNFIRDIYNEKKIKIPNEKYVIPIGIYDENTPINYNVDKNIIYVEDTSEEITLTDYLVRLIGEKNSLLIDKYESINAPKKYTYSRCDILSRKISLILFLAYNEGLSTILHKAKIKYELSDKRKVLSSSEKERIGMIPFKDCYLYYDIYPLKNSLLLNGLLDINTKDYEYELFDDKDVYLEIFFNLYGTRTITKGFDNFYELFIDGITEEILEDLNYPTDITGLMLYANELLQDNQYINESEMSNYRLRSNEMINVIFEKELESAYNVYKNSINGATPTKISLPQDAIIKALSTNKYGSILQDYDTLNPIKELDSISTVTYRGPGGLTILHHP